MVDRVESSAREELFELVGEWVRATSMYNRIDSTSSTEAWWTIGAVSPLDIVVPAALQATITNQEPWRSVALEDARYFLALPTAYGIGMEILLENELKADAFEGWPLSIAPLPYRIQWLTSMSGESVDWQDGQFARVAREDEAWRIVELWNAADREMNRSSITMYSERVAMERKERQARKQDSKDTLVHRLRRWLTHHKS